MSLQIGYNTLWLLYLLSFLTQFLLILFLFVFDYPYQGIFTRGTLVFPDFSYLNSFYLDFLTTQTDPLTIHFIHFNVSDFAAKQPVFHLPNMGIWATITGYVVNQRYAHILLSVFFSLICFSFSPSNPYAKKLLLPPVMEVFLWLTFSH